jgi:hypothetical protein
MLLNARKLQAGHHGEMLVLAMEDVTERRRSEADLKAIRGKSLCFSVWAGLGISPESDARVTA